MGICAVYCGLVYNEFFAMKLNLWNSCYDLENKMRWTSSQSILPHSEDTTSEYVSKETVLIALTQLVKIQYGD